MAIFVDTNLPADRADSFYLSPTSDPTTMSDKMLRLSRRLQSPDGIDPYNLLIFTNYPQHYGGDDDAAPGDHWGAVKSKNPRVKVLHEAILTDLVNALEVYGNVPTDFPKLLPGSNVSA